MKLFDTFRNVINSLFGTFQFENKDSSNEDETLLKENETLKTEIKNLKNQLEENQNEYIELQDINRHINHKLEAYTNAKNKGCKKGDYCKNCAFGHKNMDFITFAVNSANSLKTAEYYVCEFDCCKNFLRKERAVLK